jgi:hypothetical protein
MKVVPGDLVRTTYAVHKVVWLTSQLDLGGYSSRWFSRGDIGLVIARAETVLLVMFDGTIGWITDINLRVI